MTAAPTPAVPSEPPLTDEAVAEIEARAAAATPGPWHEDLDHHDEFGCVRIGDYGWVAPRNGPEYDSDTKQGHADAELVAHARTDVPRLVASLRSAWDHRDYWQGIAKANLDARDERDQAINLSQQIADANDRLREELVSARAERVELIAERDQAQAELRRVRHALAVVQAARPPLAHSAAIVEQLALAVRAREMKPEQITADEAERGYHNAINGYREVARAILRNIDQALTVEEGTNRG